MATCRLWVIPALIFITILSACRQETPVADGGIVEANAAYRAAFGQPPPVQSGKAYARVGYLPLKNDPARVAAVPLYIYNEAGQLPRMLRQMVSGTLILPPRSPLFNPFPPGSTIRIAAQEGKALVLELIPGLEVSADVAPMTIALAETALQYEDVETVTVLVDELRQGPLVHEPQRIVPPASPELVMVAGIWESGEDEPEEIVANFDRPVTVNTFRLAHINDERVAGEYFTSVFQMAVVVHPEKPQTISEGMQLTVEWRVTDALGRVGSGQGNVVLQRFEHAPELGEFPQK